MDISSLPAAAAEPLVQLFKLLADETRLQILYFLTQRKELNVGALCELLHQSQPAVSHHLALMRLAGLIEMRREGKHNFYRLQPRKFQEHGRLLFELLPPAARHWLDDGRLVSAPAELTAPAALSELDGDGRHVDGRDTDGRDRDGRDGRPHESHDGRPAAPRSDRSDSHE